MEATGILSPITSLIKTECKVLPSISICPLYPYGNLTNRLVNSLLSKRKLILPLLTKYSFELSLHITTLSVLLQTLINPIISNLLCVIPLTLSNKCIL